MSDHPKIVITGIGVVSPIGIGKDEFWHSLKDGRSGIGPVSLFDTSTVRSKLAGEIHNFQAEQILGSKGLRNLDRTTRLALSAAKLALTDAGYEITDQNTYETGVVLGSTMGSVRSISEFDKEAIVNGPRAVNPAFFPNTVINSPASQISIRFGIKGFNTTISSGFTSSLDAIDYAKNFLLMGRASAVLAGGVEELCEQTFKGFYKLGFLSASKSDQVEVSAPFDKRRNGAVLGEGAAIFLLERLEDAQNRGAKIYGVLDGVGQSFDKRSYNKYDVSAGGGLRAISKALVDCKKSAAEIDYVASSANSSIEGDLAESNALISALSLHRKKPIVASAVTSMIGETYSAGGAFQLASSFLIFEHNLVPPTINFNESDEFCPIDCVPNQARQMKIDTILVPSISPTGQSAAIVVSRWNK